MHNLFLLNIQGVEPAFNNFFISAPIGHIFSIIDSIVISIIGDISLPIRLLVHLPMIPLVAGLSYEVIKITARKGDSLLFKMLRAPGLWLQNITTSKPEDRMVEVAIVALKEAFGDKFEEMQGKEYVAEAIG